MICPSSFRRAERAEPMKGCAKMYLVLSAATEITGRAVHHIEWEGIAVSVEDGEKGLEAAGIQKIETIYKDFLWYLQVQNECYHQEKGNIAWHKLAFTRN